jgi:hypothetical protein
MYIIYVEDLANVLKNLIIRTYPFLWCPNIKRYSLHKIFHSQNSMILQQRFYFEVRIKWNLNLEENINKEVSSI